MTAQSLIAFNLILMAALASPGAAFLLSVKTSVSAGRAAGIATGLGLSVAAVCWTAAAFLGLGTVFAVFPWAFSAIKIAGAMYLIWIAIQTWRNANRALEDSATPTGRAFVSGLLVNFGNPKSMLFAAALLVVIFPQGLSASNMALILLNHFTLEVVFYTICALTLSSAPARAGYLRAKPILDRIAALALGGFGLKLLTGK
ncbi:MAG: threonine/homoserine/homoserine lactone efflux protein [Ascidiaceihabitans sp.]|jgi:threonine/homoserine/homoserine lactone efflux protein